MCMEMYHGDEDEIDSQMRDDKESYWCSREDREDEDC